MNFNRLKQTRFGSALALGLTAVALTGCNNKTTYESIVMPADAHDLGVTTILDRYSSPARSFRVQTSELGQTACGGVKKSYLGGSETYNLTKNIQPVDSEISQVNCVSSYRDVTGEDLAQIPVTRLDPKGG